MQVAHILSDLTSLRACDPAAALALVSARPSNSSSQEQNAQSSAKQGVTATEVREEQDPDLQRAKDLVKLHYEVKMKHIHGLGREMYEAREGVRRAVEWLEGDPRLR